MPCQIAAVHIATIASGAPCLPERGGHAEPARPLPRLGEGTQAGSRWRAVV